MIATLPQCVLSSISIHHMYRFKDASDEKFKEILLFQYITCIGSSNAVAPTSLLTDIISIHHMYRFKIFIKKLCKSCTEISIHHMYRFKLVQYSFHQLLSYFNTSHVSVQDGVYLYKKTLCKV
jgi:hypothetical protein